MMWHSSPRLPQHHILIRTCTSVGLELLCYADADTLLIVIVEFLLKKVSSGCADMIGLARTKMMRWPRVVKDVAFLRNLFIVCILIAESSVIDLLFYQSDHIAQGNDSMDESRYSCNGDIALEG